MTNETAQPTNVGSNDQLGLSPERAAFEAWAAQRWGREAHRHTSATCAEWDAWQAASAAARSAEPAAWLHTVRVVSPHANWNEIDQALSFSPTSFPLGVSGMFESTGVVPLYAGPRLHDSDCAVHNAPAYPAGECDCWDRNAERITRDALGEDVTRPINMQATSVDDL